MSDVPRISKPIVLFFRFMARFAFRARFTAVRISDAHRFMEAAHTRPLIVYANHCSWWDPMVQVVTAEYLMPGRHHFAPMNTVGVERHSILGKIGIFAINKDTPEGGLSFLRKSLAILASGGVLWLTPQGRFADVRERPVRFRRGIAALATRVPGGCTLLPAAVEYVFWDEGRPECLVQAGEPIFVDGGDAGELLPRLEAGLTGAMDTLREKALSRDAGRFELLMKRRTRNGSAFRVDSDAIDWIKRRAGSAKRAATAVARRGISG